MKRGAAGAAASGQRDGVVAAPRTIIKREVVLISLFDGIGAAQVSLSFRVPFHSTTRKITVLAEYAAEIDENAIALRRFRRFKNDSEYVRTSEKTSLGADKRRRVAKASPRIELGDVRLITTTMLRSIVKEYGGNVDYIVVGGSPCQGLSVANTTGQGLLSEDSGLFFDAVTIIAKLQAELSAVQQPLKRAGEPQCGRVAFVVENVASMPALARGIMSRMLGVTPIVLRGEDFSDGLMKRRRLYWSNLPLADCISTELCDGENASTGLRDGGLLYRTAASTRSWSLTNRLTELPPSFLCLKTDNKTKIILKPVSDIVALNKAPLPTLLRCAGACGNVIIDGMLKKNPDLDGEKDSRGNELADTMSALDVRQCGRLRLPLLHYRSRTYLYHAISCSTV